MTMDYSPWSEREIWPFLNVAISPKPEKSHPPKLVSMHLTSTPTCMNFLSRFQSIIFFDVHESFEPISINYIFDEHGLKSIVREIWSFLKVAISPKLKKSCPPKLVCMHLTSTPTSMNFLSQFRLIKFFDDHGLSEGKYGRF